MTGESIAENALWVLFGVTLTAFIAASLTVARSGVPRGEDPGEPAATGPAGGIAGFAAFLLALMFGALLLFESDAEGVFWTFTALIFVGLTLIYMVFGPCLQLFKALSGSEEISIFGVLGAIVLSAACIILSFALLYLAGGLDLPSGEPTLSAGDAVYFSAVTFSTLGYGDFAPLGIYRGFAAIEAILGNLHLAAFIGAAFAALKP